MWTTLSLYGLLRHLLLGPSWGWYAAAWLAAGLGIITKGVGFLALFALLPCAWAWARGWDGVTRGGAWRWWAGACALLLPLAAWLVPLLTAAGAPDSQALAAYREAFAEEPPADIWPPPEVRFSADLRQRMVNVSRNWIVPKAAVKRLLVRNPLQSNSPARTVTFTGPDAA